MILRSILAAPTVVLLAIGLAACAPSTASEAQVASIIAENEPQWRDVIANASDCRGSWFSGAAFSECWDDERQMGAEMKAAAAELRDVEPPESMRAIVDDTIAALDIIIGLDITPCGSQPLPDLDSEACVSALGSRKVAYDDVVTPALNSWAPYFS